MSQDILSEIKSDVESNPILIYMKGTPEEPKCGFSKATVALIQGLGFSFATRDVIANPEFREYVPEFSNWPTFPQVFVGGKLIGGCDIVHELHEQGELEPLLKQAAK